MTPTFNVPLGGVRLVIMCVNLIARRLKLGVRVNIVQARSAPKHSARLIINGSVHYLILER